MSQSLVVGRGKWLCFFFFEVYWQLANLQPNESELSVAFLLRKSYFIVPIEKLVCSQRRLHGCSETNYIQSNQNKTLFLAPVLPSWFPGPAGPGLGTPAAWPPCAGSSPRRVWCSESDRPSAAGPEPPWLSPRTCTQRGGAHHRHLLLHVTFKVFINNWFLGNLQPTLTVFFWVTTLMETQTCGFVKCFGGFGGRAQRGREGGVCSPLRGTPVTAN